ncbi:carbamate kinase [Candidatus Fermentibacteria bacterium]|nr:carbamate kinase [Candidatus Fermentibacteria bacterium]
MSETIVIALGGNSIIPVGSKGTIGEQFAVTRQSMLGVARLVRKGYRIVITHGNGPVVGNILLRNEMARSVVPPMPLGICVADSAGGMGYMIQQCLHNMLQKLGVQREVVTVVTQVLVDRGDPAFRNPTKPIGPFYTAAEAEERRNHDGWNIVEDAGRGYRRVVASPRPIDVVESSSIAALVREGIIVIAVGGGGCPVYGLPGGWLEGAEAVIDKDLASEVLATRIKADRIIIITAVPKVCRGYGTPAQYGLDRMTASEARELLAAREFPAGSMGPKIDAALRFLAGGGKEVIITSPDLVDSALEPGVGTHIVPDEPGL